MKKLFIAMSLVPFLSLAAEQPSKAKKCVFPEETFQITEAFEKQKNFIKIERETLDAKVLEELEKALQFDVGYMNGRGYHLSLDVKALVQEFLDQDGTITYFKIKDRDPHLSERLLALASSYPGDNEYGYIYSISFDGRGNATFSAVAKISDSFISDCSLKK